MSTNSMLKSLITTFLLATAAGAEQLSPEIIPAVTDATYAEGRRASGTMPVRKDSPAFHNGLRDREEHIPRIAPYDVSGVGSFTSAFRTPVNIPQGLHGSAAAGIGSFDTVAMEGAASYADKSFGFIAGYGYLAKGAEEGGAGLRTDVYPVSSHFRYRDDSLESDAYDSRNAWLRLTGTPSGKTALSLAYTHVDAGQVLYPHLRLDANSETADRLEGSVRVKNPISGINYLVVSGQWSQSNGSLDNRLRESSLIEGGGLRTFTTENEGWLDSFGFKLLASSDAGSGTLRTGADSSWRNLRSVSRSLTGAGEVEKILIPDVEATGAGLFADYSLPIGEASNFTGGLRGDIAWFEAKEAPVSDSPRFFEPSGFAKVSTKLAPGLEGSVGLGSGIRFPDPLELYFGILLPNAPLKGDPGLKPTRTWQPEISLSMDANRLKLNATGFYSRMINYIAVRMVNKSTLQRRLVNSEAAVWGAKIDSDLTILPDLHFTVRCTYAQGDDLDIDQPLPEIAPLTGDITLAYNDGKWFASITERLGSRQWRVDDFLGEKPTPGWAVTDIRGGIRWKPVTVMLGVNNLLDKRYQPYTTYFRDPLMTGVKPPEPGRYIYAALELNL